MSFVMDAVGIDGLEDMKPTSGITAVGRKDRKEKEGKVRVTEDSMNDFSVWLSYLSCIVLIEVSDAADVKTTTYNFYCFDLDEFTHRLLIMFVLCFLQKEQWVLKRGICLQRGDKVLQNPILDFIITEVLCYHKYKDFSLHFICLFFCLFLVSRHHQHGRWQARIGRVAGNKDLYLGTFSKFLNKHAIPTNHPKS
ncbi:hypothetical protein BHE74_00057348 [Ensete ventricosum]|nr:hypothetical protein BHE74_00057348 [Ensete ventricosum]RZS14786.1 hypothetical protein BHM03_00046498 [Ensete ventricosum]